MPRGKFGFGLQTPCELEPCVLRTRLFHSQALSQKLTKCANSTNSHVSKKLSSEQRSLLGILEIKFFGLKLRIAASVSTSVALLAKDLSCHLQSLALHGATMTDLFNICQ